MKACSRDHDFIGAERVSRRVQNGVEIFERETKRLKLPPECESEKQSTVKQKSTRLIVDDAISRSKLFVSKRRSELGEVDELLRNLIRRPANAK